MFEAQSEQEHRYKAEYMRNLVEDRNKAVDGGLFTTLATNGLAILTDPATAFSMAGEARLALGMASTGSRIARALKLGASAGAAETVPSLLQHELNPTITSEETLYNIAGGYYSRRGVRRSGAKFGRYRRTTE